MDNNKPATLPRVIDLARPDHVRRATAVLAAARQTFSSSTVRLRVLGHEMVIGRKGPENTYREGNCACGWRSTSWTERVSMVYSDHRSHLRDVLRAAEKALAEPASQAAKTVPENK